MFSSMLLESVGTFFEKYWLVFVLLVLIIVLYVVSFVRRKKYNEQTQNMLNELKPGVKVKLYSGLYGKIVSIKETTDGKVILLEMGEGSKVSYATVDANAIYGVDIKEDVVYDKDGNLIETKKDSKKDLKVEKDQKTEEIKTENKDNKENAKEDKVETKDNEEVAAEKTIIKETDSKSKSKAKPKKETKSKSN